MKHIQSLLLKPKKLSEDDKLKTNLLEAGYAQHQIATWFHYRNKTMPPECFELNKDLMASICHCLNNLENSC